MCDLRPSENFHFSCLIKDSVTSNPDKIREGFVLAMMAVSVEGEMGFFPELLWLIGTYT